MANKQISGYGLGVSNVANKEVKNSPIRDAEQKTQDLISANPNGTTITKFSESINNQLTQYLPIKKLQIAEFEKIKAKGSEAEGYSEAVDGINNIEKELIQLNSDLEGAAVKRKQLLDTQVNETYANSNTDEQAYNFHNFANGTFGEEAQIIDGRLTYGGEVWDTINTGGEYNPELEDVVDAALVETRELAHGEGAISIDEYNNVTRPTLEKELNKLVRGEDGKTAVKDYMYQHPELIDMFISNQIGLEITPELKEKPEYKELYNLNKTDVDFNEGFVDTVLGMHDAEFQKRGEAKSPLAKDLIAKYSK